MFKKPPSIASNGIIIAPKRTFNSKPADIKVSFASILKNQIPAPIIATTTQVPLVSSTLPITSNEDISFLNKTLYVLQEFPSIFKPLGVINSLYDRLLLCNNSVEKLQIFSALFEQKSN
ncbi:hypothetical protein CDAR_210471 [Caerostris darwini]|uniref:Uncharacterized protein n=1 Tax=Caerostris darwini TaxID=1538125 RepID=A0AAV4MK76_9ARAC|nr:hypothetical protein CDAR_210471 [Caerostris darwini]